MFREVDLRSDTVTKPTPEMRRAMAEAVVGDDVYGEDPTINELQRRVAELLGKEQALFVASGTMGNLAAIMSHCWTRGQEILVGDESHIFLYEQGGVSQLGNVHVSALPTHEDGTFDLDVVRNKIRPHDPSMHEPHTGLICIENTHNRCGGRVLSLDYIKKICHLAHSHDIPVHLDGARIINASVSLGVPPSEIARECDSVSMCFSKGIGAPVGSIVAGTKEFITKVHRCRKVLGGALRQAGVLAAAALVGLESAPDRMKIDHERALKLAKAIFDLKSPLVTVDPSVVQSNMLILSFPSPNFTSQHFVERMGMVSDADEEKVIVRACAWSRNRVRLVLHSDLSQEDLHCAYRKIRSLSA
ncbi:LOW QUALITY PROTEIN: uncharacterized protein LOC129232133 [Uloborus diversus]|uniref:LOW QUALITY PROTEIN: uncharacterized protein LOC129232133 n=1 Tax=Uloborus diversus TaxID=327109 RepID=UPI00240A89A3|nr:LOW QUALITY PROTEIN: uncharacterized protein LOC129232133 [Uloborus diversus]